MFQVLFVPQDQDGHVLRALYPSYTGENLSNFSQRVEVGDGIDDDERFSPSGVVVWKCTALLRRKEKMKKCELKSDEL